MNFMRYLFLLAVLILAGLGKPLQAHFSLPIVDLTPNLAGAGAPPGVSLAIWSSTDVSLSAGCQISVLFPPGTVVPAQNLSTCFCLSMNYSQPSAGSERPFSGGTTGGEETVTAGVVDSANRLVSFPIPVPI